jgi:hypothetical protein
MNETNRDREEKREILEEAMDFLARAEELVRSVDDPYLDAYVADQINATETVMGEQLYQTLQNAVNELEKEGEDNE